MAEFIPVSLITNNLTECPICTEQFEDEVRIPRRMPCCVQSICQPCLETYSQGQKTVPCPMYRCEHLLPGCVTSGKEPLILGLLEQLKIQKGVKIPCTECPDKNNAVARCEDCCISLCEDCLKAHRRVPTLKNHSVKTFEELKDLPIESVKRVHQCEEHRHPLECYCTTCDKVICVSCTVLEHEKEDHNVISISKAHKERSEEMIEFLKKLDEKEGGLTEAVTKLEKERDMFKASSAQAKENVSSTFDSLIEVLQLKKATLLSLLNYKIESYLKQLHVTTEETKALLTQVRSSTEYTRSMRRKADQIEDIQLISSAMPTLKSVQVRKVQMLTSIDIGNEVDASKELKDVLNTYQQDHLLATVTLPDHGVSAQKRDEMQKLMKTSLIIGDAWYLVDTNWSNDLRSHLGLEGRKRGLSRKSPGPIDNKPLLKANGELIPRLVDGVDFHVYPEEAWKKLVSWFGVVDNQMPIQRKVIMAVNSPTHRQIEVYRYLLKLRHNKLDDDVRIQSFSRADTIDHLETTMRRMFGIQEDKHVRLWKFSKKTLYDRLKNDFPMTLEECGIHDRGTIIIDDMIIDHLWFENRFRYMGEKRKFRSWKKIKKDLTTPGQQQMAEFIPVSLITNNLTECPICTEQFEDEVRIPRRMPCCVQSICQPCLETYSQGQKKVPCPMCRCEHLLPGGVTSLAKEPLILRILEQLKIQKGVKIPCTECPDKNNAVARCEDCCISLCEDCLRAHRRVPTLKNHSVKTFEELKDLPIESVKRVHQCEEHRHPLEFYCTTCDKVICVSCTVLEHEKGDNHSVISISRAHKERSEAMNAFLTQLDKQNKDMTEAVKNLEVQRDMFTASSDKTKENVSSTFDSLIEVLQLKKATLLSLLDYKAESYLKQLQSTTEETKALLTQVRSSTEYTRNMRRKADQIEDIQLISSAMPTLQSVQGRKVQVLTSFDIINEVDAFKELKDLVNTYLQDVSHPETTPLFHQHANKTVRDSVDKFLSALPIMSDHDVIAQQRDEIQRLMETSLEPGDDWFLVDINWSQDLRSYLGLETRRHGLSRKSPGPIDNKPLLKENGQLIPRLVDGVDFHVYPEEAWKKLVSWFGVVDNQMPIQREVIMAGNSPTHCQIEVYRYALKLRHSALDDDIRIQSFSRADTIDHLETTMRRTFGILEDKHVRIWRKYTNTWYDRLDNSLMTLEECEIHNGVTIIIDEMNEDRSWLINPVTENRSRSKKSKAWKE